MFGIKNNRCRNDSIIMVCQVFHPDTQSTSQLLSALLSRLAQQGHAFTVLAGYPAMGAVVHGAKKEVWNDIVIERGGVRAQFKRNMLLRGISYISYTLFVCRRLLRAPSGQRVIAVTNPPYNPVVVGYVCRLKGHSLTAMLQDIYPNGLTAIGRLRAGGWIDRLWRFANRSALNRAHEIWVLGRDMKALVCQCYGITAGRIRVVPHWSSVESPLVADPYKTRLAARLGLQGKFIVQYSGNMGLWHDMDTIMRAAARLVAHADIHFILIGAGIKRASAERLSAQLGLTNLTWLPYQALEELPDSLACCHVALVSQLNGLEGIAVPCKLYGILGAGRAVIAQVPGGTEVAMVVEEERCGVVVSPGDDAALAGAIRSLAGQPDEVQSMGARAAAAYAAKYTLESAARNVSRAFSKWSVERGEGGSGAET